MKILYLNPTSCLGGAERVLLSVVAAVREADPLAELHLLLPEEGPLVRHAEAAGARVSLVPMPAALAALGDSQLDQTGLARLTALLRHGLVAAPAAWDYVRRLRWRVRRLAPDVIHSNGLKTHLLAGLVRLTGVPVLWHVHDFVSGRPAVGRLLRLARRGAAGAVAVSAAVAGDLGRCVPALPIRVLYNTVDVERFCPAPRDGAWLDGAAGLSAAAAGTVRVGLIATYARWKGHDVFLRAAAALAGAGLTWPTRFYVIGGPIYRTHGSQFSAAELRAMARRWGVEGCVGFVGFQEEPAEAFRALDVVVHASTRPEPFGLTVVEAMACGKPVVVTGAGGAAELFRDGHDALGVPPGDAEALAAAVGRLVEDAALRRRLGENARCHVLARFARAGLGERFLSLYRQARLEHSRPGQGALPDG